MEIPEIPLATNRFTPSGGVQNPIAKLTVKMTPNKIGSIPNANATGKRIGVRIIIDEMVSMNMPTKSKNRFITNSTTIGLSENAVSQLARSTGIRSIVIKRPNVVAMITRTNTVPEVKAL